MIRRLVASAVAVSACLAFGPTRAADAEPVVVPIDIDGEERTAIKLIVEPR